MTTRRAPARAHSGGRAARRTPGSVRPALGPEVRQARPHRTDTTG
ncbi:hypothetical protein [Streptomyces griseoflavus]|nr:hypothetical protein [Streptomyces griseoflavus]